MISETKIANICGQIGSDRAESEEIDRTSCLDPAFRKMCRMVDVSCLAMFLRACQICYFTEEERSRFLDFQSYVSDLEAKCFDEAGFRRL